ncbi:MAG: metal-dependent hydrolase [Chloroflexi bacterium]|nr:metal-dependent hydrolase [Chloroflexota bacterium]
MTTTLRYLNFSGFEIVHDGYRIVVDPFLAGSDAYGIPPSPVPLEALDATQLVLVSHGAFDHVGQTVDIVRRSGAKLVCSTDVRVHAQEQGVPDDQIVYVLSGVTVDFGPATVKALDVRHVSLFKSGDHWLSGQPLCFMIKLRGGPTIFHSGDTSLFSDLKLYGELHRPDVALLCVGGVQGKGYEVTPLPPDEAALALEWLGASLAIPMHYTPASRTAGQFAEAVQARGLNARVHIMKPGETIELEPKPGSKVP